MMIKKDAIIRLGKSVEVTPPKYLEIEFKSAERNPNGTLKATWTREEHFADGGWVIDVPAGVITGTKLYNLDVDDLESAVKAMLVTVDRKIKNMNLFQ